MRDPKQTAKLVAQARKKLSETHDRLEESVDELESLIRLIQAYAKGDYRDVPDPLVPFGYVDDITVILFVLAAIQRDVDAFERWEEKHRRGPSASRVSRKPRPKKSSGSAARHSPAAKRSTT